MTSNTSGKGAASVSDVSATAQNARKATLLRRLARRFLNRLTPEDALLADIAAIEASQRFDKQWYLQLNPDVAASGIDPIEHYVRHGVAEGRDPCPEFDTKFYLRQNPNVERSGVNPFRHYIEYGFNESRAAMPLGKLKTIVGPLVSVIIPVYAVEKYLAECLDSVIKQNYHNLEIIIVDDGSPDRSLEIANTYAERDSRIKMFTRDNGGLGAARNTGVTAANGTYLSFVDSDDVVPLDAIGGMVRSLQASGSDFVVGAIKRLRHGRLSTPRWVKETHAENRLRLRLGDFPEILTDVFACNKLFDSSFFREKVGPFPEDVRYEDQEPAARAYLHGVFDVLAVAVYHWRIREDGTSITQRKSNQDDLRDRFIVKQRVSHILEESDVAIYEKWLTRAIGFDLRPYFEQVPRTGLDYFLQLREGLLRLGEHMTPRLWQQVGMVDRLPALAVLAGYRDDVGVAITRREEYGYFVPGKLRDGAAYLDRDFLEGMSLAPDEEQLKLGDADLSVVACATSVWWRGDRLELSGYAYLTNVAFDDDFCISARLVSDNQASVELTVDRQNCPRIDLETDDAWNAHAKSGFATNISPSLLQLDVDALWRIEVTIACARLNHSCKTVLRDADARGILATECVAAACEGGARWIAEFQPDTGFVLRCCPLLGVLVDTIGTSGEVVTLTTSQPMLSTLVLSCEMSCVRMEVKGIPVKGKGTVFHIRLPDLPLGDHRTHHWNIRIVGNDAPRSLIYPNGREGLELVSPEHHRVRAIMDRGGALSLAQSTWWAVADEVDVGPDVIVVRGRIDAPSASTVMARLVGDEQVLAADRVEFNPVAQRFEVRIPFDPPIDERATKDGLIRTVSSFKSTAGASRLAVQRGFGMRLSIVLQDECSERSLRVATDLQRQLPSDRSGSRYGLTLRCAPNTAALWVRFRPPYRDDERGRLAQRRLHGCFRYTRRAIGDTPRELHNAILFESFGGKEISGSVLAICHEIIRRRLGFDLYWTVADMSMPVPNGTMPVLIHSRDWIFRLLQSRYLVNNYNFPYYFRKSNGQIYLQTWHGTPLEKIGADAPASSLSLSFCQLMQRETRYWDLLLAQNDYAAEIISKAFNYGGRVINLGCPGNDRLIGSLSRRRRLQVRNNFGFEPYHFVVLYAPARRNGPLDARNRGRVNDLDLDHVHTVLGDRARLVIRGYENIEKNSASRQRWLVHAMRYPDINDLLLASDLLITDYSPIMFDYAVTRKPIVYFTPDLAEYPDGTFYVDLKQIAPGPICRTNEELCDVLSRLGNTVETYSERYRGFAARFVPRDDGAAASRVVDAIWGNKEASTHT